MTDASPPSVRAGLPWGAQLILGVAASSAAATLGFLWPPRLSVVASFALFGLLAGTVCELGRSGRLRPGVILRVALAYGLCSLGPYFGQGTKLARLGVSVVFLGHCLALAFVRNAATERVDGVERPADPMRTGGLLMGLLATLVVGIGAGLVGYAWTFGSAPDDPVRLWTIAVVSGTAASFGLVGAAYVEPAPPAYRLRRHRETEEGEEAAPPPADGPADPPAP